MITTVGMFAGLSDPTSSGFHPVYLALAIGCGSKPFPWMNDSGFWVIGKMSGMEEKETFRLFSSYDLTDGTRWVGADHASGQDLSMGVNHLRTAPDHDPTKTVLREIPFEHSSGFLAIDQWCHLDPSARCTRRSQDPLVY